MREVNLILIPEQPFKLDSKYKYIEDRLKRRGHILILVAEGAGQEFFSESEKTDPSRNKVLKNIGLFLKQKINEHFSNTKIGINLKYIDPSYMIRSVPGNPTDSVFTGFLGQFAADAAMAGKTGMAIGYWKGTFTHVPLKAATDAEK